MVCKRFAYPHHLSKEVFRGVMMIASPIFHDRLVRDIHKLSLLAPFVDGIVFVPPVYDWNIKGAQLEQNAKPFPQHKPNSECSQLKSGAHCPQRPRRLALKQQMRQDVESYMDMAQESQDLLHRIVVKQLWPHAIRTFNPRTIRFAMLDDERLNTSIRRSDSRCLEGKAPSARRLPRTSPQNSSHLRSSAFTNRASTFTHSN
jgi:hypothetical protein